MVDAITEMYSQGEYLSSARVIQSKLKEKYDVDIQKRKLIRLMHSNLGMRYKRVKEISWQANSSKNLLLRHIYAIKLLDIDLYNKIILNVDETWIG